MDIKKVEKICKLIRYDILTSTTEAGSGHPTSSLSAVELMATLFFGGFFRFDFSHPTGASNERIIFSKGHAAPLLYSLYHTAGLIKYEELLTLRKFDSRLEGHPTPKFPFVDVATGSLGQGLSIGVGMALGIKLKIKNEKLKYKENPKVWVLLGDSEMAEGQVWEAMEIASYYKLNNLIGILDVNRLGQSRPTMAEWDLNNYAKKAEAFGWEAIFIEDGHDLNQVYKAFEITRHRDFSSTSPPKGGSPKSLTQNQVSSFKNDASKPKMIIAKTIKGKGVSFLENKEGWHGKALDRQELKLALKELGKVDCNIRGKISKPNFQFSSFNFQSNPNNQIKKILNRLEIASSSSSPCNDKNQPTTNHYPLTTNIATREAFGDALVELGEEYPNLIVLDAEVANSTYENTFQKRFPERFFQMFIAEQNMLSAALGLSKMGYIPFVSTFAAFLTRAFDQIRMAQYSIDSARYRVFSSTSPPKGGSPKSLTSKTGVSLPQESEDAKFFEVGIKIVGSHAGVSIGEDGPSQMGLEDIAMMTNILNSTILYPSDGISANNLTKLMVNTPGIVYLRTTRGKTPVVYDEKEIFEIGGMKIHQVKSPAFAKASAGKQKSKVLIISAGITLHEALKAQKELFKEGMLTTVVDLYCVKPLDNEAIKQLCADYTNIIVVEDHYPAGGIGEAILSSLMINDKFLIDLISNQAPNPNNQKKNEKLDIGHSLGQLHKLGIRNFIHLCVRKLPMSGTPEQLLHYEEIDATAIVKAVESIQS